MILSRQVIAGAAASMSLFTSGAWYVWVTPLLPELLGPDSPIPMSRNEASWIVAIVELGCLLSPLPSVFIADRFGRKNCILLCIPIFFINLLLTILVKSVFSLCVARVLVGFALCIPYTVLPLYLGEISSPETRGTVTSFFHIFWGLGCLFPYCIGQFLSYDFMTYATFGTTLLFFICFIRQPESPYFYAMNKRSSDLNKALGLLRESATKQSIENEQRDIELEVMKVSEELTSWYDIVATPVNRRALLLIFIVGTISFLSGQNAILSYSTDTFTILKHNGFFTPYKITLCIGISAFLGSSISTFTSDRYGRRFLLLSSSIGCMLSLFIASAFFYLETETNVEMTYIQWVSPVSLMAYNLFVTSGMHPVCVTYTSELFPTKIRGIAASISNINLTLSSFFVLKMYETIYAATGGVYFIYLFYGTVCLIGITLFYLLMPETKGKTFLEIRESLERSKG